jgi:hypothetical protein
LQREKKYDVVFVPTVLVHQLLGWTSLIKRVFKRTRTRIILFFPNTPIPKNLFVEQFHARARENGSRDHRRVRLRPALTNGDSITLCPRVRIPGANNLDYTKLC